MTDSIAGLPFWDVVFDAEGDLDGGARDALLAEVPAHGITDLYIFTHGWNNERRTARRLYDAFFGLLAQQLEATPADPPVVAGFAGVFWPSKRWSDEPIPDFAPNAGTETSGTAAATPRDQASAEVAAPTLDDQTMADLIGTFPAAKTVLERMAALLNGPPTDEAQAEFLACLKEFTAREGVQDDDGERAPDADAVTPRMLGDDHQALFGRFRDALRDVGVDILGTSGGQASIGDALRGIWNGAKEALRQATYWQMKNRAGVVGRNGLGPLLGRLATAAPQVRVHLIGHSFGARLVSYALAGLPAGSPSPVKSVTLLQGAFSHFAFAQPLPFDAHRQGALAGMQARIDGPLTVCFSSHDGAVGTFYPLASIVAHDDTSGANRADYRWGGMGADGAQNDDAVQDAIQSAGPDAAYRFARNRILNVDASEIVRRGGPPTGAHSDIVHPELTWIVLSASRT
jgi:hypothetical protein